MTRLRRGDKVWGLRLGFFRGSWSGMLVGFVPERGMPVDVLVFWEGGPDQVFLGEVKRGGSLGFLRGTLRRVFWAAFSGGEGLQGFLL